MSESYRKYAFERYLYLDEDDEEVFNCEDECRWKDKYLKLKASRQLESESQVPTGFDRIAAEAINNYQDQSQLNLMEPPRDRRQDVAQRRRLSPRVAIVLQLLDGIENKFNLHPTDMDDDFFNRLDSDVESIKDFIRDNIDNKHLPVAQKILNDINDMNSGHDILTYLYHKGSV